MSPAPPLQQDESCRPKAEARARGRAQRDPTYLQGGGSSRRAPGVGEQIGGVGMATASLTVVLRDSLGGDAGAGGNCSRFSFARRSPCWGQEPAQGGWRGQGRRAGSAAALALLHARAPEPNSTATSLLFFVNRA